MQWMGPVSSVGTLSARDLMDELTEIEGALGF